MAAPSYTTDLSTISQADEASGTWAEPTATGWGQIGTIGFQETDFPLQGATTLYCMSGTVKTGVGGLLADAGASGVTIPTDGAALFWVWLSTPGLLDASNSIRGVIGSGLADFYWAELLTKADYTYGGWRNLAMADPSAITVSTQGSPTSTRRYFGWCFAVTFSGTLKGNPYGQDALRYGRCEARFNGGDLGNGYATFGGFATQNDGSANRWGLIQKVSGGYLWKGLITLGYTSAVDFRDANTMLMIDDTRKVTVNFNKIEIRQAGSRVDWTAISFVCVAPSTTASKGRLEVIDDCDVNISGCTFTDMDTFIFKATSDVLNSVFRRCNTITANNAKFAGTLFDSGTVAQDTSQLIWDVATDPSSDLAGCTFVKGANAHHAIEFGTNTPSSFTLTNMTFTGFNAANAENDSALHIKATVGTVTITLSGTSQPSYKSAGATVEFVTGTKTVKVIVQESDGTKINQANVFLATGEAGNLPYKSSVTIVNSGNTATVTHTSHGMATNDKVWIEGASLDANNGVFTITRINDNSYSYTMGSSPGQNPTGTITATFVWLKGLTDSSGELYMSRSIPGVQLANGWARKSSTAPYYKTGVINGDVITTGDTTFTAILSPDE